MCFPMVFNGWHRLGARRGCRFRTVGGCTARESLSRKSRVGFEPGPRRVEGLLGRKKAPKRLRRGSEGAAKRRRSVVEDVLQRAPRARHALLL